MKSEKTPKIALVTDWLTNMGGAEHLFYSLHKAFPNADIYTSVFDPEACPKFKNLNIRTTYLQKLPRFVRYKHMLFPTLRAGAFRNLDLSAYDVVISAASAEAKAIRVRTDAIHICYCHTPTRYYWSHYNQYKKEPGFGWLDPFVKLLLPVFVRFMRQADRKAARKVDYFIANSHEVQHRIKHFYRRNSTVIFPPVETKRLTPKQAVKKGDYYLIVGRQIPYKRIDLAIRACNITHRKLIVIGNGSQHEELTHIAGPTITFKTKVDDLAIVTYFQKARGFIFPAHEDFGIVPVEAMAAGTPVIAFGQGGALNYIVPGTTGVSFDPQTIDALVKAIGRFEQSEFNAKTISKHAEQFSEERFIKAMQAFVKEKLKPTESNPSHGVQ